MHVPLSEDDVPFLSRRARGSLFNNCSVTCSNCYFFLRGRGGRTREGGGGEGEAGGLVQAAGRLTVARGRLKSGYINFVYVIEGNYLR